MGYKRKVVLIWGTLALSHSLAHAEGSQLPTVWYPMERPSW